MAKQRETVVNPVYGEISPLAGQLLSGAMGNRQGAQDTLYNLAALGELDESLLTGTLKRAGSRREQQVILDAITAGRQSRFGGGGVGRGSSTPHYSPAEVSQGDYGYIEINGEVRQDGPSYSDAVEQAKRQAMQEEAFAEQQAQALGTIAGRTGADAQAARQMLGVPTSPGYEALMSPEQDRVIRTRMASEAAQRSQIEKYASQPNMTQANIESLWQQHEQQYPEFAGGQRPPTREEQMQQMQAQELATYQQAVGDDVPLARDHRGQISVIPGWAEAQTARNTKLKYTRDAETDAYKREIEAIDLNDPVVKPAKDAPPEEITAYEHRIQHNQRRRELTHKRYFGGQQQAPTPPAPPEPGSPLPVNQAQYEAYQQQADAAGLPLVVDQDDYDALDNKNGPVRFIDAADGQTYEK